MEPQPTSEALILNQKRVWSAASSGRELLVQGRRAFERGDDAPAFDHLSRLREHGNQYADVHYMLGILHERRGELDAAVASLRRAVRTNPSYVEALLALASLHELRGDFDLSASYAERASQLTRPRPGELDPTTRGKLANQQAALGDALLEAGERREAIEEYRRAVDRCPNFHDIRHRLGIALRDAGLPFQAAQEFRRILAVHGGMLESQIQLGLTYYSLGRTPEAVREWEAVLERDPSRDEARMYLRLVRGATREAEVREAEALKTTSGWSTRALDAKSDTAARPSAAAGRDDTVGVGAEPLIEIDDDLATSAFDGLDRAGAGS